MSSEETNKILQIAKQAEDKKSQLEREIQDAEKQRQKDKLNLRRDQVLLSQSRNDSEHDTVVQLREAYEDKKRIMDDDHELANLTRKLADYDKNIGQIKHWTSQSEHENEADRAEALKQARDVYSSM